jgi:hypothetical protein
MVELVMVTSYEWECPNCHTVNEEETTLDQVSCIFCKHEYTVSQVVS